MSQEATIQLDQYLKLVGVAGTGGQAKGLIQAGAVLVNGEVELRRGRRLQSNDVIELNGETFTVSLEGPQD